MNATPEQLEQYHQFRANANLALQQEFIALLDELKAFVLNNPDADDFSDELKSKIVELKKKVRQFNAH